MLIFEIVARLCLLYVGILFAIMVVGMVIDYIFGFIFGMHSVEKITDPLKKLTTLMAFPWLLGIVPIFVVSYLLFLFTS